MWAGDKNWNNNKQQKKNLIESCSDFFGVNSYLLYLKSMSAEIGQDEKHLISMCVKQSNRSISRMLEIRQKETSTETCTDFLVKVQFLSLGRLCD